MDKLFSRFGIVPYFITGAGLIVIGVLAVNHILNSFWPIDVDQIDLVRDIALDRADTTQLMRSANLEIVLSFLAAIVVAVVGLMLPLAYYLNKRFGQGSSSTFLIVLRQAMWVAIWAAFCTWLQLNRALGWGLVILVAAVFVVLEVMLQVRTRAANLAA